MEAEEYLQQLFAVGDVNGDGVLQPSELADLLTMCGMKLSPDAVLDLVEAADLNHDGVIQYSEFVPTAVAMICAMASPPSAEEQAAALASMSAEDAAAALASMSDEERAAVLTATASATAAAAASATDVQKEPLTSIRRPSSTSLLLQNLRNSPRAAPAAATAAPATAATKAAATSTKAAATSTKAAATAAASTAAAPTAAAPTAAAPTAAAPTAAAPTAAAPTAAQPELSGAVLYQKYMADSTSAGRAPAPPDDRVVDVQLERQAAQVVRGGDDVLSSLSPEDIEKAYTSGTMPKATSGSVATRTSGVTPTAPPARPSAGIYSSSVPQGTNAHDHRTRVNNGEFVELGSDAILTQPSEVDLWVQQRRQKEQLEGPPTVKAVAGHMKEMPEHSKAEFVRKRSQSAFVLFDLNIGIDRDAALAPTIDGWWTFEPDESNGSRADWGDWVEFQGSQGQTFLDGAQIGSYHFEQGQDATDDLQGVATCGDKQSPIEAKIIDNGRQLHLWSSADFNGFFHRASPEELSSHQSNSVASPQSKGLQLKRTQSQEQLNGLKDTLDALRRALLQQQLDNGLTYLTNHWLRHKVQQLGEMVDASEARADAMQQQVAAVFQI